MTYHTAEYKDLSDKQRSRVEQVIMQTSCTEARAIAELIAEEWDVQDAVTNVYATFPEARFKLMDN